MGVVVSSFGPQSVALRRRLSSALVIATDRTNDLKKMLAPKREQAKEEVDCSSVQTGLALFWLEVGDKRERLLALGIFARRNVFAI